MTAYPFVFTFRDLIAGKGYFANVTATGRVLLVQEDDGEWYFFGVQPGCIAGGAAELALAKNEFKKNYLSVLLDVAAEAGSYEEFAAEVTRLLSQTNEPNVAEWTSALDLIRSGKLKYPGIVAVEAADKQKPTLEISLVTQRTATPELNADVEPKYSKAA